MSRFNFLTVQRQVTGALHLAVLLRLQHLIILNRTHYNLPQVLSVVVGCPEYEVTV